MSADDSNVQAPAAGDQGQLEGRLLPDHYLATVGRLSLVSWGDGSSPSLPSIASEENTFVSALSEERLAQSPTAGMAGDQRRLTALG
jgi:hypothetical protein